MTDVDIIVPVFNAHDMTWRCVTHLLLYAVKSKYRQSIVVVDDGSTERADSMFRYFDSMDVTVLHHAENGGCHKAWNTGWRYGSAPYVCFINNDIVPAPKALDLLVDSMIELGAPYMGAFDISQGGPFDPVALTAPPVSDLGPLHVKLCTDFNSFFVVRRSVLEALGGFDDSMKLVFADADFVERVPSVSGGRGPGVNLSARCYHGRSVTRKRVGVFRDVEQVMKDQAVFREKWKDRPDVLAKHPPYTRDSALSSTQRVWSTEGER